MIRRILTLFFILYSSTLWANANQTLITDFENKLNHTQTLKADLLQKNPDGTILKGSFYLQAPNKMRIHYYENNNNNKNRKGDFILSDGTFLYYWDAKLKQQSHMLLKSSPAAFLLKRPIRLRDMFYIEALQTYPQSYEIKLKDKKEPDAPILTLLFNKQTKTLKGWSIEDSFGNKTEINLTNIERNIPLPKKLFFFKKPKNN